MKHNDETIEKFMTPVPHTIGDHISIKTAQLMLQKYGFRHLPVQKAGKLVGIVSDRDLKLALSFGDIVKLTVADVMTEEPYAVTPDIELAEVVRNMAEQKYGCTVITEKGGKVVGIFTSTDGLRICAEMLQSGRRHAA